MSCELEGLGLRGKYPFVFLLYLIPLLALSYTLLPSLALGFIMSKSSTNDIVSVSLFFVFFLAGFLFFNRLHRYYYGVGTFKLAGILLRGVRSAFSRIYLERDRLVQEYPTSVKEVELRGGKILLLWTVSPVLLFLEGGSSLNGGIVLLRAGFGKRELEEFMSCLSRELGIPEERINLSYFRGFILSGFRYRREIKLSGEFDKDELLP